MGYLDLLILESKEPREAHPTVAHIYVSTYSRGDYKGHEDKILVCAECLTVKEVDEAIDNLQRDLEAIRKKAKAKLLR